MSQTASAMMSERQQRRERNEHRMTMTLAAISIAFVVCTMPPAIILTVDPSATSHPYFHVPLYILGWMFGIINPVIYLAFNQTYKEEYSRTLKGIGQKCKGCCNSCAKQGGEQQA